MEKSRNDIITEKAKMRYAEALKIIGDMYDSVFAKNDAFPYTRVELFADFDAYLQAALITVCYENGNFGGESMRFIENITDYGKLIEGTDITFFADCVKDMRDKLAEKAEERLKEVSLCFKLSGAVDSGREVGATKALLDHIIKIAFNLKLLNGNSDVKNNADIISALKSIYVFMMANGISIK